MTEFDFNDVEFQRILQQADKMATTAFPNVLTSTTPPLPHGWTIDSTATRLSAKPQKSKQETKETAKLRRDAWLADLYKHLYEIILQRYLHVLQLRNKNTDVQENTRQRKSTQEFLSTFLKDYALEKLSDLSLFAALRKLCTYVAHFDGILENGVDTIYTILQSTYDLSSFPDTNGFKRLIAFLLQYPSEEGGPKVPPPPPSSRIISRNTLSSEELHALELIAAYSRDIMVRVVENAVRMESGKMSKSQDCSGYNFATSPLPPNTPDPFANRDSIAGEMPEDFNALELTHTQRQIALDIAPAKTTSTRTAIAQIGTLKTAADAWLFIRDTLMIPVKKLVPTAPIEDVPIRPSNSIVSYLTENQDENGLDGNKSAWRSLQRLHHPEKMRVWIYAGETEYLSMLGMYPWVESRSIWPGDLKWQMGHYLSNIDESKTQVDLASNYEVQWKKKEFPGLVNHPLASTQKSLILRESTSEERKFLDPAYRRKLTACEAHLYLENNIRVVRCKSFLDTIVYFHARMLAMLRKESLHLTHRMSGGYAGGANREGVSFSSKIFSRATDNRNEELDFAYFLHIIPGFPESKAKYFWARFGTMHQMQKELNALESREARILLLEQIDGISDKHASRIVDKFCVPTPDQIHSDLLEDTERDRERRIDAEKKRLFILQQMPKKGTFSQRLFFPKSSVPATITFEGIMQPTCRIVQSTLTGTSSSSSVSAFSLSQDISEDSPSQSDKKKKKRERAHIKESKSRKHTKRE
jgi:hypothetical protein